MSYKECPKCEGYGWVEGLEIVATPDGPSEKYTEDNCLECDGEGRISKEESNNE